MQFQSGRHFQCAQLDVHYPSPYISTAFQRQCVSRNYPRSFDRAISSAKAPGRRNVSGIPTRAFSGVFNLWASSPNIPIIVSLSNLTGIAHQDFSEYQQDGYFNRWEPHEWTAEDKEKSDLFGSAQRSKERAFWTQDEKWVYYNNTSHGGGWSAEGSNSPIQLKTMGKGQMFMVKSWDPEAAVWVDRMHVKSYGVRSPHISVMWKLGEKLSISSSITFM
ncbi:hypothetical protein TNCV_3791191 [Trichonephila clavipes]|nr:hypothetical protein TNCV_3791191 [Trichonephila clavipes]